MYDLIISSSTHRQKSKLPISSVGQEKILTSKKHLIIKKLTQPLKIWLDQKWVPTKMPPPHPQKCSPLASPYSAQPCLKTSLNYTTSKPINLIPTKPPTSSTNGNPIQSILKYLLQSSPIFASSNPKKDSLMTNSGTGLPSTRRKSRIRRISLLKRHL